MPSNVFVAITRFSFRRGSNDWFRSYNQKSGTRAIPAADPNNRLEYMKAIVQTAKCRRRNNSIKRSDSVLVCRVQPAARYAFGLTGSMVCYVGQQVTRSRKSRRFDKSWRNY